MYIYASLRGLACDPGEAGAEARTVIKIEYMLFCPETKKNASCNEPAFPCKTVQSYLNAVLIDQFNNILNRIIF